MNPGLAETVLDATGARRILDATVIQSLWSGYGEIVRLRLAGGLHESVVLKHITAPEAGNHPRGWNTGLSHQRKIRSYQVEAHWYRGYAYQCAEAGCHVPQCLAVSASESETVLVLTDLDAEGFHLRRDSADLEDMRACLNWLARMHATFLGREATGLWESGSYWHLDTRPDELAALEDANLRDAAPLIDRALRQCRYQTLLPFSDMHRVLEHP